MPTRHSDAAVHVLHLGDDENRFAPAWIAAVNELLDTVVRGSEAAALVAAATELVRPLAGKDRETLASIKSTMFTGVAAALRPAS